MSASDLISRLTWAEVDGSLRPDVRRALRAEREYLQVQLRAGRGVSAAQIAQVVAVADAWGVAL